LFGKRDFNHGVAISFASPLNNAFCSAFIKENKYKGQGRYFIYASLHKVRLMGMCDCVKKSIAVAEANTNTDT